MQEEQKRKHRWLVAIQEKSTILGCINGTTIIPFVCYTKGFGTVFSVFFIPIIAFGWTGKSYLYVFFYFCFSVCDQDQTH